VRNPVLLLAFKVEVNRKHKISRDSDGGEKEKMQTGGGPFYQPIDSSVTPRFAGPSTFMRLPAVSDPRETDIAIYGVPWDGGTTNRSGPRHGPRQVREMSSMIRRFHGVTRISPFELCRIADFGDAPTNPIDLLRSLETISTFARSVVEAGTTPLAVGGDHLCSLPLLRAFKGKGPLALIHFDAHHDMDDTYFGGLKYTHGTPFRRAIEEGLIDPKRTVQIGIRGSTYYNDEEDWVLAQGVRVIHIEEVGEVGIKGVVNEIQRVVGDSAAYLTFDVDSIDPAFAPGTGTPEFGGLLPREVNSLLRGLNDINLVGADIVEVSPPFDPSGGTAFVAANVAFEILCILAVARSK
jgi:guanidinopropionase